MNHGGPTKSDPDLEGTLLTDVVLRLRQWGTDRIDLLKETESGPLVIGSADSCWLRLSDPKGQISRRHAELLRQADGKWVIRDLKSKNGMLVDGLRCTEAVLEPGLPIKIGGTTLLAESDRSASLRAFLGRILGWKSAQTRTVDVALKSVRMVAARRSALVICGEDDLVAVGRSLHRRYLGPDRPFVVCDPRRKRSAENVRNAENYEEGMPALKAATRGTLCVWSHKLPRDFGEVKTDLEDPDTRVHLVVCARDPAEAAAFGAVPITVRALADRTDELERIVAEYAGDAMAELGLQSSAFNRADHEWVLTHETATLPEIEKATLRLLALRLEGGNVSRAAARLGMARMSLYKWIGRRKLPIPIRSPEG